MAGEPGRDEPSGQPGDWQRDLLRDLGGLAVPPVPPVPEQASESVPTAGREAGNGWGPVAGRASAAEQGSADGNALGTWSGAVPPGAGLPSVGSVPSPTASSAPGVRPDIPGTTEPVPDSSASGTGHGNASAGSPMPPLAPQANAVGADAPAGTTLPPVPGPYASPPAPHPAYAAPAEPSRAPTPVSVPLLPADLAGVRVKPRHGESVTRRAGRMLRRVFASSAAAETEAVTRAARAIQQPVTTGRQIAVSSIRGGAGKSTVAALLALTYAHYRTDPVLAVEADPALGTLPHRLGAREVRWSGTDLARIVDPSMQITDLTGYLLPFAGGGWLLPGSQGAIGARLDIESYRVVMTSLRRYFATTVVDTETLPAEVARTALVTTQARVLVSPATVEGVLATRSVLEWMGGVHRGLPRTAVVVLNQTSPDTGVDMRKAMGALGVEGPAVLPLPYDRHLAGGGAVRPELLGASTREAVTRLAAEVMDRAMPRAQARRRTGTGPADSGPPVSGHGGAEGNGARSPR
ncbi:hypothetical protein [Streptomyces sp. NPDC003077]|uniref:hypothetical protein n=1 Tax=Streptomyces sp. NPDC003077 TaxID=3154443 RepID=UPI0033B454E4